MIPEILLIIDTSLKFFTGFYQNGIVIVDKVEIMSHYLRKGLIFDILAYFPIVAQSVIKDSMIGGIMLKFFQLLIFCKIKRVQMIMTNFENIISLNGKHDYILNLVNLLYQIIFFTHIIACIWHGIAYYNNFDTVTWLDIGNIREMTCFPRYLHSLYWSVSVMITITNSHCSPQNNLELSFGVIIFLVSSIFFGFSLNSMREIFDKISKNDKEYK